MWQQIMDLPGIVQGALGSALFWLSFELSKRIINFAFDIFAKVSKKTKKELKVYEALYHARCSNAFDPMADVRSILASLRRFLYAMVYICLGLISSNWFGQLSLIAYGIAIYHVFIALRAIKVSMGNGLSEKEHKERYLEIMDSLQEMPNKKINKD